MKIFVEPGENSFKVRFSYDSKAVEAIKTIPGRQFRKDLKCWLVPKSSAKALDRFVKKFSGEDARQEIERPYVDVSQVYPSRAKTKPWRHQLDALRYIWNKEAALIHLDMGIGGKSRIVVDYVLNFPVLRTLILAPLTVVPVWPGQFAAHGAGGGSVNVVTLDVGTVGQKVEKAQAALREQAAFRRTTPLVLVINYDTVWREPFADWILELDLNLLVLDEAQRVKSRGGRAAIFCYQLASGVPVRVGLSGTPAPHSPMDFYGLYRVLDPTIFGTSAKRMEEEFFIMGGFENRQNLGLKPEKEEEFQHKIDSIRFHVKVDDSSLPGELHTEIPIELPPAARKIYTQLSSDFYAKVASGEVTAANAAVAGLRCQQLTSGFLPVEEVNDASFVGTMTLKSVHTAKSDALLDLLSDVPKDTAVVVFCRFRYDLDQIHEVAKKLGRESRELSGRKKDPRHVRLPEGIWKEGPETILATQLRAGSVGVDLTRAHIAVFFSYTYSLEEYEQSLKRTRRPGQTRTCLYYHLCVVNSIDWRIRRALEARKNVIDALLERD